MVASGTGSCEAAMQALAQIKDPEVPVLNIVEMGIVRNVQIGDDQTVVEITPTYSGCPAMEAIESLIRQTLTRAGYPDVEVKRVYSPAWTTDWMTAEARRKLREYGIAPPPPVPDNLVQLETEMDSPDCPYCGSSRTELRSSFGATACKAMHYCQACQQPFESFKAI